MKRRNDATGWSDDELLVQPPGMEWILGLVAYGRDETPTEFHLRPANVHLQSWPSEQLPVVRVVYRTDDIARRRRAFKRRLRELDPDIVIEEHPAVFK